MAAPCKRSSVLAMLLHQANRDDLQIPRRHVASPYHLVPTALPRRLELSAALMPLEQAIDASSALQARLGSVPFHDNMIRVESKLDALALDGAGPAHGALLRLMIIDAAGERSAPRDLRAAVNALDAFRHGLAVVQARGRAGLDAALLGEMHWLLRNGAPAGFGSPRGEPLRSRLPVEGEADAAMRDLEQFLIEPPSLPLVIRLALVTARLELLAPFGEASAPLARLLMPLMAVADGRPPLFLAQTLAARSQACDAALAELQRDGRWEGWICFFLSCLTGAANAASARLQRAERLRLDREADIVALRSDSTARRLTELAFGFPVLTVGAAQEMLDVSFQTANAAVATLVRLGILAPHSNIRRNRVFIFRETLSMLAEPDPEMTA